MKMRQMGKCLVGLLALGALATQAQAEDLRKVTVEGEVSRALYELGDGFSVGDPYTLEYVVDLDAESTITHSSVAYYEALPMSLEVRSQVTGEVIYSVTTDPCEVRIYNDFGSPVFFDRYIVRALADPSATTAGTGPYSEGQEVPGVPTWMTLDLYEPDGDIVTSTDLVAAPDPGAYHTARVNLQFRFNRPSDGWTYYQSLGLDIDSLTAEALVTEVDIDIKPNSTTNAINLGSHGNVPVAILSSSSFDAEDIDPTTVTLANASVQLRGKKGNVAASLTDVNGDGLKDLVVHIDTETLELNSGDIEAVLTGLTTDGRSIRGVDGVTIVND